MIAIVLLNGPELGAGGITADVGLTPPADRWIFRTQLRYMERGDDPTEMDREMEMLAAPAVLAYGLRPNLTVIARQIAFDRRIDMKSGTREERDVLSGGKGQLV